MLGQGSPNSLLGVCMDAAFALELVSAPVLAKLGLHSGLRDQVELTK